MTIPIYTPDTDTATTTTVDTDTSHTPAIDEQLQQLDTEKQQAIDDIHRNYNDWIDEFRQSNNPYDAIINTVQRRQLHDPRVTKARQALGSLYDAFQIIGSAAGMAAHHDATPPAPALSSAANTQNQYAHHIRQLQLQEDDNFRNTLRNLSDRKAHFDTSRNNNIRQLRSRQQQDIINTQQFYDRQRNNIINKEKDRKARENNAVIRANTQLEIAQSRQSTSGNSQRQDKSKVFDYNNVEYMLPAKKEKDFSASVGNLMNKYYIYADDYKEAGLTGISLHMAVLKAILDGEIQQENTSAYNDALKILNTYLIEQTKTRSTANSNITPFDFNAQSNDLGWN